MPGEDTRQKILDISLKLFAKEGFHAVSIRDICREVRIKESSIYYHFKNKSAILEELQRRFQIAAAGLMRQLDEAAASPGAFSQSSGESVSQIFFERYLMDGFCNSFLRLLGREQSSSAEMRQLYDQWFFDEPLRFQSKIFAALFQAGAPGLDCDYLAVRYYAPIYLYLQRYLLSGELTEEKKEIFRQKAAAHSSKFFAEIGGI